nr:hypothetical protein [Tanacetum cinerariifolium]GEW27413.1 hypothetical protein [Tanacetum cinerariifolium]
MHSSRMDNSRQCQDMMSNIFTSADLEFFKEGVHNESAIKRSWKLLCQSAQQQANDVKARFKECKKELAIVQSTYNEKTSAYDQLSKNYDEALTREKSLQDRVGELEEEKKDGEQLSAKQAERIEQLEEAPRQTEADAHQLRLDREKYVVEAGRGEMVRSRIINDYLPTFVRRLHQRNEYKWSLGKVFSLAIGKGFIDGISIGRKDPDIQAILKATPNVDPTSSDIFKDIYEKLFDKRYPYVDKVARLLHENFYNSLGSTPNRCSVVWARLEVVYRSLEEQVEKV